MFDWFKKYKTEPSVDATSLKTNTMHYVELPKSEKPANVYYRIGTTDNNRVSFQMGYSEITMNKEGVDNLIRQLSVFRDQLADEEEDTDE